MVRRNIEVGKRPDISDKNLAGELGNKVAPQPVIEPDSASSNSLGRIVLGSILLAPAVLCFILNLVIPAGETIRLSFQKADLLSGAEFVGLQNYSALFSNNPIFFRALTFTLSLVGVRLLLVGVVPLLLALAVNEASRRMRLVTRLLFTIPLALTAPVMIALSWGMIFNPTAGLVSSPWLADPARASLAILLVDGLYTFGLACGIGLIFYLAALRGINKAESPSRKAFIPLGAAWITGLLATIALSLPSFTLSFILTRGGPANSTVTLGLLQYTQAFQLLRFGPATAIATLILGVLALLGLIAGLIVILTGLRLELIPPERESTPFNRVGKPVVRLGLGLILLLSLGVCSLSLLPLPWNGLNSLKTEAEIFNSPQSLFPASFSLDAYSQLGEVIPLGRTLLNSLLPLLAVILFIQLPLAYLGGLGIGAFRPFGKWSEWLLLPFSPWLFVTLMPLSLVFFQTMRERGWLDTLMGLAPPLWLNVPMLFILTLFFKGQEPKWQAARAEGQPPMAAFFKAVILPSLPLALLLACAALFIGLQNLLWPLVVANSPENYTVNVALVVVQGQFTTAWPLLAAALTLFWLPAFIFFFFVFGLFQLLYLDRLALVGPRDNVVIPQPKDYVEHMAGLHREIWQDVDTTAYLDDEREAWQTSDNK